VRRGWRKFILFTGGTLLTLLIVVMGGTYWLMTHPEQAWRLAKHFLPADLEVTWQEIRFNPEKITWTHWNIDWQVKGLKITKGAPKVSIPIDDAAVVFSFSVWKPETRADFDRISLHALSAPVIFEPGPSSPSTTVERSLYEKVRDYLHYLELGGRYFSMRQLDVQVKEWLVPVGNETWVGALTLTKPEPGAAAEALHLKVAVQGKELKRLSFDGWLNPTLMGSAEGFASLHTEMLGYGVDGRADLAAIFQNETLHLTLKGPWYYGKDGATVRVLMDAALTMDANQLDVELHTPLKDLPKPVVAVDKLEGQLHLPLTSGRAWSDQPGKFSLKAPIDLFFVSKDMRPPLEQSCACKIPERLLVSYTGSLWMRPLMTESQGDILQSRLAVESVTNKLFDANLALDLGLAKRGGKYAFLPKPDSEIHLHSVQGLRSYLDARGVLIPAPFSVLDGTIDLSAHGDVTIAEGRTQMPVNLKVALASENQQLRLGSTITLDLDSAFKDLRVFVSVLFQDLQLQLPPLDPIGGTPKVVADSRVILQPPVAPDHNKKPPRFRVQVFYDAKTASPGAIRLFSKYALPNIPLTVDIQREANEALNGSIQFEPFRIQYLRRTVHVEQMRLLVADSDNGDFPIDGRFRIDQTQYRITVEVSGTLRQPLIRLSSDPYLEKNEIISVLLYDRTSDQLVGADAETVGSFNAALADRAIGLFGLWAFASTPIRSFSYNPVTKVYAATVQLADGLTAGIGTDWEEAAHLEVRKRVSRRWVLTASWAPSDTDRNQVGKLELQWEKRF
jgi:hypothetical protein